ncbi:MAG TPA: response regulator [Planctomycetota bacterium]|jgi:DNA-binding response OmpR family regulator|nr:response regulator [Planctomycetota bacterium]
MANILIFEDEADIAELYRLELEDRGHRVLGIYADPDEVLQPIDALQLVHAPDLILLDDRLGSLSGLKFLKKLRRAFPKARILMVSADPDALDSGLSGGAHGIAKKPIPFKRLAQEIESMLVPPAS